jgi:anti-sigma factor RsiW
MSSTDSIEQQLDAYIAGCLCGAEAEAIEQQITSDPAVARAYADARLRADACANGKSSCEVHDDPCEPRPAGLLHRLCRFFCK